LTVPDYSKVAESSSYQDLYDLEDAATEASSTKNNSKKAKKNFLGNLAAGLVRKTDKSMVEKKKT